MYMHTVGILISSASQPVLRRNRIFGGKAAGIEVTNGGGGSIEENEVFGNYFDGICLATGVSPTIKGTYLYMCVCVCLKMLYKYDDVCVFTIEDVCTVNILIVSERSTCTCMVVKSYTEYLFTIAVVIMPPLSPPQLTRCMTTGEHLRMPLS